MNRQCVFLMNDNRNASHIVNIHLFHGKICSFMQLLLFVISRVILFFFSERIHGLFVFPTVVFPYLSIRIGLFVLKVY